MSKKALYIISFLFFLASYNITSAGFGVSPGQVNEENLVPGSHFENTVYLVQGKPDEDLTVKVSIESRDAKDWFTFGQGKEFVIPAGVQQFPLNVKIDVPEDTELGEYKAFVRVNTVPPEGDRDGQVNISIGGRIDYSLTVGDNVITEYSVSSINFQDIKENENPKVEFKIKNTGNVSASPVAASFELFNKFGTVRLGFSEVEGFKKVPSFSEEAQVIEFPIDIKFAPGEYWGDIKVYNDKGETIASKKTVFNVEKLTFMDNIFGYLKIAGYIVLGVVILFILLKVLKRKKRKKTF